LDKIVPKYSKDTLENKCPMCRASLKRFMYQKKIYYDTPEMILGDYDKITKDFKINKLYTILGKIKVLTIWIIEMIKAMGNDSEMFIYLGEIDYYKGSYDYQGWFIVSNPTGLYFSPSWTYESDYRYTNSKELVNGILNQNIYTPNF
jgi:hypothetical protein